MFQSVLTFGQLLEMVLQVAQGIRDGWGGVCRERHLSWSGVIRGSEFVSRGRLEGGYPLRIPKALVKRSNSAVRATRAEHSRRFLSLDYAIEWVTTHLQEIPQRIR